MKELYDHQRLALRKLSNGKILYGGVGSGKTLVAATYYKEKEAPRDVYVITTARKRDDFDWQDQFYELGLGPKSGPAKIPDSPATARRLLSVPRGVSQPGGDDGLPVRELLDEVQRPGSEDPVHVPEGRRDGGKLHHVVARSDVDEDGSESRGDQVPVRSERHHGVSGEGALLSDRSTNKEYSEGHYPWVVTVDSWNNIAKYADVAGAFFIFDEQRLVGAGDWSRKFLRIAKRNRWILLSATPGDTWMDYVPVFIANGFYKNRTEFKHEHVVYNTFTKFPKVDRYINVGRLVRQRSELLIEMPVVRHTRRRHVEVLLPYDKDALDLVLKDRWHVYEDRPIRDVAEMFLVGRKVVNSDPSRLEMVKELWKNHPKLIVFYNFNYELDALRSLAVLAGTSSTSDWERSSKTSPQPSLFPTTKERPGSKSTLRKTSLAATRSSPTKPTYETEAREWTNQKNLKDGLPRPSGKSTSNPLILPTGFEESSSDAWKNGRITSGTKSSSGKERENLEEFSTAAKGQSNTAFEIAEWNGHKHQPIPRSSRWIYLVQYVAGAEAWDCIETDAMVKFSKTYSWKVDEQAEGRIDRINTPFKDLWYYGFTSDSFVDKAIGRSLKAKESFNANAYKGMFNR